MNSAIKKPHNIFITPSLALALLAASGSVSYAAVSNPASTTTTSTTATTSTPEPAHLDAPLDANNWLNFRQ